LKPGLAAIAAAIPERWILQGAAARTLVVRSGWLLACPHWPDLGRREGSLVKSAAPLELLAWPEARKVFAFRASRPALGPPQRELWRERRRWPPWRRRERPGGPP